MWELQQVLLGTPKMACTIDLGSDICYSPNLDLNLTLRASVEILFPTRAISSRLVEDLKNALYSGNIWVEQVPELRLHFHVNSGSDLDRPLTIFASQLGDIICTSKLWLELGLGTLFRSCDHISEETNSTTFKLSFGLRRRPRGSITTETARRPAVIKTSADAIPPAYFPVVQISAINISMIYNRRIQQSRHIPSSVVTVNLRKRQQLSSHQRVGAFKPDQHQRVSGTAASSENSRLTLHMKEHYYFGEDCEQLQKSSQTNTVSQCANYTSPSSEFNLLFDIGFRAFIVDKPVRLDKYPLFRENELQSISKLAPSIFSPGYREAMNDRSQLMLLIAKSMCSILKSRRDRPLQDRVTILESSHRHRNEGLSMVPDVMDTKTTIVTSLWCIAQKQLYKPKASRKLSPLWPIPMPCSSRGSSARNSTEEIIQFQDDYIIETEGSDYYLGTDGEDEGSYVLDETNSLLSHGEDMPDHSDKMDCQDTQLGCLGHNQTTLHSTWQVSHDEKYISTAISLRPDPSSDDEMLVSDCFDGYVSSPMPTSPDTSMLGVEGSCGKECDFMLCDQF